MVFVAPQSLAIEPVFGGISGCTSTILKPWEVVMTDFAEYVNKIRVEDIYLLHRYATTK